MWNFNLPHAFAGLGRVIPFEHCFLFTPDIFLPQLQAALTPYAARLYGQRFYLRLERRGLKGRSSPRRSNAPSMPFSST
jgi:hypothetical protein